MSQGKIANNESGVVIMSGIEFGILALCVLAAWPIAKALRLIR